MARNQIDTIDLIALIAFPLAAGIELGVWTLGIDLFEFDFAEALFSVGETGISTAMILAVLSIAGLATTGTLSEGNFQNEEWYAVVGSIIVLPAYALIPAVQSLVDYSPVIPAVIWLALSGMAVFISYKA